jgi:hypothetical protein
VLVAQCGKQLRVRSDDDGRERKIMPRRAPASFEVGQSRELAIATGDLLLLRPNAPGFVNGERVRVRSFHRHTITLVDGRTLPVGCRAFAHGCAVTSRAAQGIAVDEMMLVFPSPSFAAVSQGQFSVSISRAKESVRIHTDDAGLLKQRVQDAHTRKAAGESGGYMTG